MQLSGTRLVLLLVFVLPYTSYSPIWSTLSGLSEGSASVTHVLLDYLLSALR